MNAGRVTIALLTRNRPHYLQQAINSILAQRDVDLELLVLDNASSDDTPRIMQEYAARDPRVIVMRSETNLGMVRNWNRGIGLATSRSPFACIFHDDDLMLPDFLAESIRALSAHPSAGFSFCLPQFISQNGEFRDALNPNDVPVGLSSGHAFLELAVNRRACGIYPPCVVFRSDVLTQVGPIDSPHVHATMDLNLYYRIARIADVYFIPQVFAHCRRHDGSETDRIFSSGQSAMLRYGLVAELIDVVGYLLGASGASDPAYRGWLAERLHALHAEQSAEARKLDPSAYHAWETRRDILLDQIERTVPLHDSLILIDDEHLAIRDRMSGRCALPLIERDGQYLGAPHDGAHAIAELERLRLTGVRWLVVGWTSMWYLEIYADLRRHLQDRYALRMRSPHGVIYELA